MTSAHRGRRARDRKSRNLPPKPVILILCEGETERPYLDDLRKSKRLGKRQILITASGTDPSQLLTRSKKIRCESSRCGLDYDEAWCVFDRDEHRHFSAAIAEATNSDVKLAVSVPCFELWYLLHFEDQTGHLERDTTADRLKRHIPEYDKTMKGCFKRVLPGQPQA